MQVKKSDIQTIKHSASNLDGIVMILLMFVGKSIFYVLRSTDLVSD